MHHLIKTTYPLIFSLLLVACTAEPIEPIDRQPISKLSAAIKKAGHERIAQGVGNVVTKDSGTGEVFNAKTPLMVTSNPDSGEWTVSVLHDQQIGSTLLIGNALKRPDKDEVVELESFDRKVLRSVVPAFKGAYGAAYYTQKINRLERQGYEREFSGTLLRVVHPFFNDKGIDWVFADILVNRKNDDFIVLAVDKRGVCFSVAFGGQFAEND